MSDYADVAAEATENLEPAGDPGEAGAAAAPAPAVPDGTGDIAPSSGEGAAPTWTGPTQDEWQAFQQRQAELEQQLAAQPRFDPYTGQPLDQSQLQPEIPEPWDPDYAQKMAAYLDHRDQQVIERTLGPVQPFVETAMNEQAGAAMNEALTALKGEVEGFTDEHFKAAELVGNGFLGETGGDPYEALKKGAEYVTQLVKAERAAAVEHYKEGFQRGNGHPEPGATGGGISSPALGGSYTEIAETFAADPGRIANY